MAYARDSKAYDLSIFEEAKTAEVVQFRPNKKQEKSLRIRQGVQSVVNTVVTFAVCAMIVGMLCLVVAGNAELAKLQSEIRSSENSLSKLESEYIRLTDELARQGSTKNVEEYARDVLGMQKANDAQIQYISIDEGDKAVVCIEEPEGFFGKAAASISNFFSQLAYLFE